MEHLAPILVIIIRGVSAPFFGVFYGYFGAFRAEEYGFHQVTYCDRGYRGCLWYTFQGSPAAARGFLYFGSAYRLIQTKFLPAARWFLVSRE